MADYDGRALSQKLASPSPDEIDEVIDAAGIQLIAVIPEELKLASYAFRGTPLSVRCPATEAFGRLAARLEGDQVPLMAISRF